MSQPKNKTWADVAFEMSGFIGLALVILSFGGCVALCGGFKDECSEPKAAPAYEDAR